MSEWPLVCNLNRIIENNLRRSQIEVGTFRPATTRVAAFVQCAYGRLQGVRCVSRGGSNRDDDVMSRLKTLLAKTAYPLSIWLSAIALLSISSDFSSSPQTYFRSLLFPPQKAGGCFHRPDKLPAYRTDKRFDWACLS